MVFNRQKWFKALLWWYSSDVWNQDGPYDGWHFHQDSEDELEEELEEIREEDAINYEYYNEDSDEGIVDGFQDDG